MKALGPLAVAERYILTRFARSDRDRSATPLQRDRASPYQSARTAATRLPSRLRCSLAVLAALLIPRAIRLASAARRAARRRAPTDACCWTVPNHPLCGDKPATSWRTERARRGRVRSGGNYPSEHGERGYPAERARARRGLSGRGGCGTNAIPKGAGRGLSGVGPCSRGSIATVVVNRPASSSGPSAGHDPTSARTECTLCTFCMECTLYDCTRCMLCTLCTFRGYPVADRRPPTRHSQRRDRGEHPPID